MLFLKPWYADNSESLASELLREVPRGHELYGIPVVAIARRYDRDDVLFALQDGTGRVATVHLTWQVETDSAWPKVRIFSGMPVWLEEMKTENASLNKYAT